MMKTFIGVKAIKAELCTHGDYALEKFGKSDSKLSNIPPEEMGYKVIYDNDYVSWSPKDVFEESYFPLVDADKISEEDVDIFMGEVVGTRFDEKTTIVTAETLTGFRQYETSSCVDPKNYDHAIGKEAGRKRIEDSLWKHLGFVLQWAKFGLNNNIKD